MLIVAALYISACATPVGVVRVDPHITRPHRAGRISVVLIHGTASSPARWAEMINELLNDRRIDEHYDLWYFVYNTGNPITYTASLLYAALTNAVRELDPEGNDAGLRRMVLIGHSQGGLLAKMMVIDTGDRLWRLVSDIPFEKIDADEQVKKDLQRSLFFKPLPFVRLVVFIATLQSRRLHLTEKHALRARDCPFEGESL